VFSRPKVASQKVKNQHCSWHQCWLFFAWLCRGCWSVNISKFTSANFKIQRPLFKDGPCSSRRAHQPSTPREEKDDGHKEQKVRDVDPIPTASQWRRSESTFERALGRKEETSAIKVLSCSIGFQNPCRSWISNFCTQTQIQHENLRIREFSANFLKKNWKSNVDFWFLDLRPSAVKTLKQPLTV
jgi:hypothetical protein